MPGAMAGRGEESREACWDGPEEVFSCFSLCFCKLSLNSKASFHITASKNLFRRVSGRDENIFYCSWGPPPPLFFPANAVLGWQIPTLPRGPVPSTHAARLGEEIQMERREKSDKIISAGCPAHSGSLRVPPPPPHLPPSTCATCRPPIFNASADRLDVRRSAGVLQGFPLTHPRAC